MTSDPQAAYPKPPAAGGITEVKFGVEIRDPYRLLEDGENEVTKAYVEEQNALIPSTAVSVLPAFNPQRPVLETSVREELSRPHSGTPSLQGDGYHYWLFKDVSASRDVMLRSKTLQRDYGRGPSCASAGEVPGPEVVFDPSKEKGMSLYASTWSPSGKYFCAVLQNAGNDWQNIRIFSTAQAPFVPLELDLTGAKFTFGATFLGDDGVLYKRLIETHHPPPPGSSVDGKFGLFYHRIGTNQEDDILVWHGSVEEGKSLIMGKFKVVTADPAGVQKGRRWLVVDTYKDTTPDSLWMVEIPLHLASRPTSILPELVRTQCRWVSRGFDGMTNYVGSTKDGRHLFTSTANGSSGSITYFTTSQWDAQRPDSVLPLTLLVPPHQEGFVLKSAHLAGDRLLILVYLKHACAAVVFVDARSGTEIGQATRDGTFGEVDVSDETIQNTIGPTTEIEPNGVIPEHANIYQIEARADSPDFYLSVDTFISPPYILHGRLVDPAYSHESLIVDIERLGDRVEPDDLVCQQVFYPALDGTTIPMFICHQRSFTLPSHGDPGFAGTAPVLPIPTLLHAYGGFATPILPTFSPFFTAWIKLFGGIVAIANIRGGGEYGEAWHKAAVGVNRTVAFDDFAAAAMYLHNDLKVATPQMTAAYGTSNGGLLVAAAIQRHPDLWGVGFPDVALTDMCRFHLFTLGTLWIGEYGNPDSSSQLPQIHAYSPYHNTGPERAAILVTTGENDTRVIPGHSLKYTAALQAREHHTKPSLPLTIARIYEKAGHEGGNKDVEQKVEEIVDRLIFALIDIPVK